MSNPFRDNMIGMAEDEKMTCVGCGKTWYAKWFKDGFCNECQNNGTYERYQDELIVKKLKGYLRGILIFIITVIILSILFGFV